MCSKSYKHLPARGDASIPTSRPLLSRPYAVLYNGSHIRISLLIVQHQHLPQLYHTMKANHKHREAGQGNMYRAPHADDEASAFLTLKRAFKAGTFAEYLVGALKIAYFTGF